MINRIRQMLFRMRHKNSPFPGSAEYWDRRYRSGGTSGMVRTAVWRISRPK